MKDDGLTFVFFRKLQSVGVSPTSSKSLALNDTFNNFSSPCFWPVGWRKVKIKQPHHATQDVNLSTGLHLSNILYIDQAPGPNHGRVDGRGVLHAWQTWKSHRTFQPKKLDGRRHFGDQSPGGAIILCKVQWLLYVPSSLTSTISKFCPWRTFICFIRMSEQRANMPLYTIN